MTPVVPFNLANMVARQYDEESLIPDFIQYNGKTCPLFRYDKRGEGYIAWYTEENTMQTGGGR